ncbi:uncharacterized protein L201_004774 [Kwoniella dendrophila CBS 6074]|uniref:Leucine carboxyl methyltransferase 1 n=1 Tax=Kwoniella dendrophila CBS 6074 TaxID=1295534 RepID=A0AAX4JWM4_9TREE
MLPPRLPLQATSSSSNGNGRSGMIHPDDAIRQTDDDASSSRASAISLGYLNDPFSSLLYKPNLHSGNGSPSTRKPPLINIGTHHRTIGIDTLFDKHLKDDTETPKQVVSLGAGSDTRFWRLMSRENPPNISKYVEIDFPHITSVKAQRISRSKKLNSLFNKPSALNHKTTSGLPSSPPPYRVSQGGTRIDSDLYTLLPLDLRSANSTSSTSTTTSTTISEIFNQHLLPLLNPELPTLFLAECLFPYMLPEQSENIIQWFGENFSQCIGIVYEMSGLNDGFGKVMKRNLASRNLSIPGSEPFPTPESQAERFLNPNLGPKGIFDKSGVKTLWEIREQVIDINELQRISKLEILDEIEELKLVLEHYVIAWGVKGENMESLGL